MRRQKIKVLVVENDLLFLQLLTCYLQLEGYDVCAVCNNQRAADQAEVYAPDLILLDVAAPGALTVCPRIRERTQVPIICITAVRAEEKSGLIELGADDYLSKPFDAEELLEHIQQTLQRKQSLENQQAHALVQNADARVKR